MSSAIQSGYDVMVAYNLAKVDARVRFPLPAPEQLHRLRVTSLTSGDNSGESPVSLSDFYSVLFCGIGIGVVP